MAELDWMWDAAQGMASSMELHLQDWVLVSVVPDSPPELQDFGVFIAPADS